MTTLSRTENLNQDKPRSPFRQTLRLTPAIVSALTPRGHSVRAIPTIRHARTQELSLSREWLSRPLRRPRFRRRWGNKLTARVGKQQIVWGESDLYRSIDVINPLRIDQNQGAGEKFDEFRSPIWALKLNYSVGNVGSLFSNVFIEPFYTPGFRGPNSDLIVDGGGFRAPFHMGGCLNDDNELVDYSAANCSFRRSDGSRVFVPWNPSWRGRAQSRHPWAFINRSANPIGGTPDFDNSSDSLILRTRAPLTSTISTEGIAR